MLRIRSLKLASLAALNFILSPASPVLASQANDYVNQWLQGQSNLMTWSADFVQTRTLRSLTEPLREEGKVWFAAPNRFRWELGSPPKTIAVRQPDQMIVLYPLLKRAEKYPLNTGKRSGWSETLELLEAGFPRNRAELENRYRIQSTAVTNGVVSLELEPRSRRARRMMPLITVGFGTQDLQLRFTELEFADDSTMRNDFTNVVINPGIPPEQFEPDIASDYEVVEPLKEKRNP